MKSISQEIGYIYTEVIFDDMDMRNLEAVFGGSVDVGKIHNTVCTKENSSGKLIEVRHYLMASRIEDFEKRKAALTPDMLLNLNKKFFAKNA